MIKKRYVAIFIILALVVIFSSIYTYHKNYTLQLERSQNTVEKLSESAKSQYDATFFQICQTLENTVIDLTQSNNTSQYTTILKAATNDSYFIDDMIILNEDGSYYAANDALPINVDTSLHYFAAQETGHCIGLVQSTNDENIFYAVNLISIFKDKHTLLLVGLNYNKINQVTRPETYNAHNSYVYLLSGDGFFLYHPDKKLMGKNLITDAKELQEATGMDDANYSKIIGILKKPVEVVNHYYFQYNTHHSNKIAYANRLEAFNGVLFIAADYDAIQDIHFKATMRTLIPLVACFILALYTLLRYIFLIKYTDYFTEVKNDLAFRKRLHKHLATSTNEEHYLILKIENVIHAKDKDFLYDDSVFYNISNYFKELSPYYNDLYRISRVHYVFVLKNNTNKKVINSLLNEIRRNVCNESDGELYISGKILLLTLDHIKSINNLNDVDNRILNNMDDYYSNLAQESKANFVKYSDLSAKLEAISKEKNEIEKAIINKEIIPYYQPIVDLRTGEILKHEVLLRLSNEYSTFTAGDFIKIAERDGLITKVDKTMIRQAFKMYNHRLLTTGKRTPLSINLSAKSINSKMKRFIVDSAKKCDITPSDITFELTETSDVDSKGDVFTHLKLLRSEGFKIAIDDFGTGYAHVALLSKLQVDYIKIDGVFIKDMNKDKQKLKTLNALVYLAKNYNTRIIAEYMDTIDSIEILKKMGVEYGQGHYFGKAMPHIK